MKKIVSFICVVCAVCASFSCSDLLDTESTRSNIDPNLDAKTDSLFYAYGIMQAMQQLADQYVLQGEMRGDLVATTQYTDSMISQLAEFRATAANRYDSAYVYYRVINNCNYYLAHRNTTLVTGANNVVIHEYAAVKAFRAWAYLQLARNYKRVKFFTEPLTQISQIDDNTFPELDMRGIVDRLAPDLEPYTGFSVPTAGLLSAKETVAPNWGGGKKTLLFSRCYIPVDVILGELYLETGQYEKAASHYVTYLTRVAPSVQVAWTATRVLNRNAEAVDLSWERNDVTQTNFPSWRNIFALNVTNDVITYIPMAANAQYGVTTNLPLIFGADYYATPDEQTGYTRRYTRNAAGTTRFWDYNLPLVTNVQVVPSTAMKELSDSTEYYVYAQNGTSGTLGDSIRATNLGDMRLPNVVSYYDVTDDNTLQWIVKFDAANVVLYRTSTIWLHLAEAYNRLGLYDLAFAILKDGISDACLRESDQPNAPSYISDESKLVLQGLDPQYGKSLALLTDSFIDRFPYATACGIHCHGTSKAASDQATTSYRKGRSPYRLDRMVGLKLAKIAQQFGVATGTTKADTINAIEDMLCDEYALELAFEGRRYYDLLRLARHKNASGAEGHATTPLYSPDFGSLWLARKLAFKSPAVNLQDPNQWYLPFN